MFSFFKMSDLDSHEPNESLEQEHLNAEGGFTERHCRPQDKPLHLMNCALLQPP